MTCHQKLPGNSIANRLGVRVWSGIKPLDTRLTWVLETLPVMMAFAGFAA